MNGVSSIRFSLRHFAKGEPPPWLELNRVLDAFQLSHDRRGRTAYVAWLESRAASHGGKIDEAAMESLRKGWYLGEESFKDKLLAMVDKARAKIRKPGHHAGGAVAAHHQREAERIIRVMAARFDLPTGTAELATLRKGHPGKVRCAALVRLRTAMENDWIAARLAMGGSTYVSSLVNRLLRDTKERRALQVYERALDAECKAPEKRRR